MQRAQRKLYLDQMVNRKNSGAAAEEVDEEELAAMEEEPDGSLMFEALSFGANAIFAGKSNELPSDEDIAYICDRTRHEVDSEVAPPSGQNGTPSKLVNGQLNTGTFDATEKMVDSQSFKSVDFREVRTSVIKAGKANKVCGAAAEGTTAGFREGPGRKIKNRITMQASGGSGMGKFAPVLNSNNYGLLEGESSIFDRELGGRAEKSKYAVLKNKRKVRKRERGKRGKKKKRKTKRKRKGKRNLALYWAVCLFSFSFLFLLAFSTFFTFTTIIYRSPQNTSLSNISRAGDLVHRLGPLPKLRRRRRADL